jgi:hypothetical protein
LQAKHRRKRLIFNQLPQDAGVRNSMVNSCPQCRHILPSGRRCQQPALREKPFCHHHCRSRNLVQANRARNHSIALPPLEDRSAIQMSIDVVLAALDAGKINRRTAATYAYAIKIGSDNLSRMEKEPPLEPVEICRGERGDILAAEPQQPPCPTHETASPSHGCETTDLNPPDTNQPQAWGDPGPEAETGEIAVLNEPDPTQPSISTSEFNNPETLEDLRDTSASHEYDPEIPIPPGKTELRKKRRQAEQNRDQQREALRYWMVKAAEKPEGENPQLVIDCIKKNLHKIDLELAEISRLEAPDPKEPDPPL